MKNIQLYNKDNLEVMATLPDGSIDIICIDPPYLYLKNQKLERAFDEPKFFRECYRLLTKKGFIVMFGRGVSFYRWNTILADLDFVFKEEIIWNKIRHSSPLTKIARVHETISIFSNYNTSLNEVKVNYGEVKKYDLKSICGDLKRLSSFVKGKKTIDETLDFLNNKKPLKTIQKTSICVGSGAKKIKVEHSLLNQIFNGMREKSIITIERDHYTAIHPTQKPVRLLERLLNLAIPKDKEEVTIADFFAGSGSCMEAVLNLQKQNPDKKFTGIATEIDEEYFEGMKKRIENLTEEPYSQNQYNNEIRITNHR